MDQGSEQNKTEEPTAFKLKRARERGMVARGADLGFFSALAGLAIFAVIAGQASVSGLGEAIRRVLIAIPPSAHDPAEAMTASGALYGPTFQMVALCGLTIAFVIIVFEIVQLRGLVFTTKPLKPDFNRLNPAQGLKRLFSFRMLKETLKNIIKLIAYGVAAALTIKFAFDSYAQSIDAAPQLGEAMEAMSLRLLFSFIAIALLVAALDQVISRQEFLKQMRMSRSELAREHKEREGEPRLKQRRRQLHAEFARQTQALGNLKGSDLLIVNPQHYAVALKYDAATMDAPEVRAKGRNLIALRLKRDAALMGIPIFERPALARALFRACDPGDPTPPAIYRDVAVLYLEIMKSRRAIDARSP